MHNNVMTKHLGKEIQNNTLLLRLILITNKHIYKHFQFSNKSYIHDDYNILTHGNAFIVSLSLNNKHHKIEMRP